MEIPIQSIVAARHCKNKHQWADIYAFFGATEGQVRGKYVRRDKRVYESGNMPIPCPICFRHGISFDIKGNYAIATSTDGRVRTLEDLLAAAKVDLSIWQVAYNGFKVGTWEAFAKKEDKDLTFVHGVISGHSKSKGVIIKTLYRTEARLVRRSPIPIKPIISPSLCPVTFEKKITKSKSEGCALLLSDPQFGYEWKPPNWKLNPFHDRRAIDVSLQIATDLQPQVILWLGDILDLTTFTDKFARKPEYYNTVQPAVYEVHWWLRQFREHCPKSEITLHEGNHDIRIRQAMASHLQDAYELKGVDRIDVPAALSIPGLLALKELGIDWVGEYPEDRTWLGNAIQCQHGHIAKNVPLSSVKGLIESSLSNQACGHIHRDEMVSRSFYQDGEIKQVIGYCPGCLCRLDGVVPGSRTNNNWRQGIGIVEWAGENVSITHIPIINGSAVYSGEIYKYRDRIPQIKDDFPDWNW